MPTFTFSLLFVASTTRNPLTGWQYEYLPWPAKITLLVRSTTAGNVIVVTSGSETIVEESPVQAGGTIGVIPNPLNTSSYSWIGAAGDRLKANIREILAGTPTVDGVIEVEPLI